MMQKNVEIRKLPSGITYNLVRILEVSDDWKKLMAIIPRNYTSSDVNQIPKYKVEHINLIEQAGMNQKRSCSEIFLEEWGTSGRKRPDLSLLLDMLGKAELFRAADYITGVLNIPPLERPPDGPSAAVSVSNEIAKKIVVQRPDILSKRKNVCQIQVSNDDSRPPISSSHVDENKGVDNMSILEGSLPSLEGLNGLEVLEMGDRTAANEADLRSPESEALGEQQTVPMDQVIISRPTPIQLDTSLPHINYVDLDNYTDHFNEIPKISGGRNLGTGAFGAVYLGMLPSQQCVAVKRLYKDAINAEKQFRTEVETLSKFRHTNLLQLVGFSCDSETFCLVYDYMSNGSLQSRLAIKDHETGTLNWLTRLKIALGTAHGILYLHTAYEKPLIHRDIKSANILLDENLVPKLGDFGLVRLGQQQGSSTTQTTTVLGTSAYMAPEAFRGDVSVKLDTFSFGVVLLEILTSLAPYDEDREGHDLVTHVEAMCEESGNIGVLLDRSAGDWGSAFLEGNPEISSLADNLYAVACKCIEDNRQKRPLMSIVVTWIENVLSLVK